MATETVIQRPAPFVEEIGQKLSEQALGLQDVPVVTTGIGGITRQTGETDEGNIVYQLVTMTQSEAGADIGFDMYKHNGLPVYFTVEQMRASLQTTDTTEWYDVPNPFGVSP